MRAIGHQRSGPLDGSLFLSGRNVGAVGALERVEWATFRGAEGCVGKICLYTGRFV